MNKGTEDDILEFAKRMNARWNELRESLHKVSTKNLFRTEPQLDNTEKVLVHGEAEEKHSDSILTTLPEVTEANTKATKIRSFYSRDRSSRNL